MLLKQPTPLLALALLADLSCATRVSFIGRRIPPELRGRVPRSTLSGSSPVDNSADLQYSTNITIGGAPFEVLIDTGSSDLWVAGTVASGTSTGKAATINYASGGASGPVQLASVGFAGYTIPKQAFIQVVPDKDHPVGQGLIGLGPSEGSVIHQAFEAAADEHTGHTVLDNIFLQNTATPNYITFLLGRLNDPSGSFRGDLTVGEVLTVQNNTNLSAILDAPKLKVTEVSLANSANQHFQVLLDPLGFIGPDGNPIPVVTQVSSTSNKKQATVIIDTGFSLPQVPAAVAKSLYSRFPDSSLVNDPAVGKIWYLPCTQEVNVTLKFGGIGYPVHPMDSSIDPKVFGLSPRKTAGGKNACLGLFQPVSFDTGKNPTFDMIFGMAFLRNVYTLIDFGDFIADSKDKKADPYIQFLSITNPAKAHADFVRTRLGGIDTTTSFAANDSNKKDNNSTDTNRTIYYLIAAGIVIGFALILLGVFIIRRRRSSKGSYKPLHLPGAAPGGGAPPMYQTQPMYQQTQPYGVHPPTYNPDRPYDPPTEHVPYHNPFEGPRR
ncbi:Peptidase A1 domain-containing protein [Mycena indigotica]|uniref:Peptidase A1 domain-containing protein n=1 Tax=Mycena indigotica TaxID=2126181 RepID=A0A8H6SFX1_9AGAR|nr:Peptidase A1 domain-containing protein [Mycena indigotica]KAF7298776.1 Peptidase A1 domain-containing protein [Mycena indigotica]